ncbi:OmpA family protein [Maribacter litopenaei]|uniref:OmpA family protein n=1 Tax=Maribacter litopenaei TaxID=2976127 RepID=A0ABY5Y9G2_9FLAO|nr:OmpA family protein [Maribacter litopenaei]UWX55690.1 OmpA family protein [Maribacter litopenaei]
MVFGTHLLVGQNLIKNSSFELFENCPIKLGNLKDDLIDWDTPTLGSTDYFNACSQAMGTPKNFNGEQPAEFGVGYVGLYLYAPDDYREYIQAQLISTLQKDKKYKLSFYVSLAEKSDFAVKEFGILFTETPIQIETRKVLSKMHLSKVQGDVSNHFEIRYSDFYSDDVAWVKVEKEFVANGTEQYLIIGNFKDNKRTNISETKRRATQGSYYYLDMVSLVSQEGEKNMQVTKTKLSEKDFSLNTVNTFKSLLFEFDRFEISQNSKSELMEIVSYLNSNSAVSISITGHTDNVGEISYNLELSKKRAAAVAKFLLEQGVEANRIAHDGYGSSGPLKTNKTIDGRHENRRVEFILTNND